MVTRLKRSLAALLASCSMTAVMVPSAMAAEAAPSALTTVSSAELYAQSSWLSITEFAVMMCQLFANGKRSEYPVDYCIQKGWLDYSPDEAFRQRTMTRGEFSYYVLKAADVLLYDPVLYGLPARAPDEMSMQVLKYMGLCGSRYHTTDRISKGEAAMVMAALSQHSHALPVPEILEGLNVVVEEKSVLPALNCLLDVPAPILDEFQSREWTFVLGSEYLREFSRQHNINASGLTSFANKRIDVSSPASVMHEFGHFLDDVLSFIDQTGDGLKAEILPASAILGDYSTTNTREYFAEFFDYWIYNRDDKKNMAALQEAAPRTYAAFEEIEAAGWTTPIDFSYLNPERSTA